MVQNFMKMVKKNLKEYIKMDIKYMEKDLILIKMKY